MAVDPNLVLAIVAVVSPVSILADLKSFASGR